jgi:uncharacterized protein (DUF927 family)
VEELLRKIRVDFLNRYVPAGASGEVSRAAGRFALIGAAGELATRWGLTGWQRGEAIRAATRAFKDWLTSRGTQGSSDMEAALRQVRSFVQTHGASRFQNIRAVGREEKSLPIRDRAGFVRFSGEPLKAEEYLFFPEVFRREACSGFSHRLVLKELDARRYLKRTPPDMTEKPYVPGLGQRVRLYCIRAAILEGDE